MAVGRWRARVGEEPQWRQMEGDQRLQSGGERETWPFLSRRGLLWGRRDRAGPRDKALAPLSGVWVLRT